MTKYECYEVEMWNMFGVLMREKVPILQSIDITRDFAEPYRSFWEDMLAWVKLGNGLEDTICHHGMLLHPLALLYISLGEENGTLPKNIIELSEIARWTYDELPKNRGTFYKLLAVGAEQKVGIPRVLDSMSIGKHIDGFPKSEELMKVSDSIRKGQTVYEAFSAIPSSKNYEVQLIRAGEASGELINFLRRLAWVCDGSL